MSGLKKGDRVYNKFGKVHGVVTAVLPERGNYQYWVEYENSDSNEWYSENEISLAEDEAIDEQTIMFWNLQLQFMARSSRSLADSYHGIRYGSMYERNEYSKKMERLLGIDPYKWSEEDHNCLATHLALQLSGLA